MCQKRYCYCRDCHSFHPTNEKVKVKVRRCDAYPNCKQNRVLVDTRHAECKQRKKVGHAKEEEFFVEPNAATTQKMIKLDARRCGTASRGEEQSEGSGENTHKTESEISPESSKPRAKKPRDVPAGKNRPVGKLFGKQLNEADAREMPILWKLFGKKANKAPADKAPAKRNFFGMKAKKAPSAPARYGPGAEGRAERSGGASGRPSGRPSAGNASGAEPLYGPPVNHGARKGKQRADGPAYGVEDLAGAYPNELPRRGYS